MGKEQDPVEVLLEKSRENLRAVRRLSEAVRKVEEQREAQEPPQRIYQGLVEVGPAGC